MGGRESDLVLLDENGIRCDGRKVNETRKVTIKAGVLKNADGSAYIEFGGNKILAGVFGPRDVHPKHLSNPDTGILRVRYHMEPFSVGERKNPAPSRREIEISKVVKEALEPAVILDKFPRTVIDVFLEILQADGGTRCAALDAASVALADAGIPMRDMVCACAAGKVADTLIIDVNNEEDQAGQADMPVGYMPNLGKVTLLQLDGVLTTDEYKKWALKEITDGQANRIIRKTLAEKMSKTVDGINTKVDELFELYQNEMQVTGANLFSLYQMATWVSTHGLTDDRNITLSANQTDKYRGYVIYMIHHPVWRDTLNS